MRGLGEKEHAAKQGPGHNTHLQSKLFQKHFQSQNQTREIKMTDEMKLILWLGDNSQKGRHPNL